MILVWLNTIFRNQTNNNPRWLCGQITSSLSKTSLTENTRRLTLLPMRCSKYKSNHTYFIIYIPSIINRWTRMRRLCWRIPTARSPGSTSSLPWGSWSSSRSGRLKCCWRQSLGYVWCNTIYFYKCYITFKTWDVLAILALGKFL